MKTLFDYIRLRSKGLSPATAWKCCVKFNYTAAWLLFTLCILAFCMALAKNAVASNDLYIANLQNDALNARLSTKAYIAIADKLERSMVACLNGDGLLVDGVDRPCKVGEYVNGRDVF